MRKVSDVPTQTRRRQRRKQEVLIPHGFWDRPELEAILASRDVANIYAVLNQFGISQRRIAAMTEQSQSEISEILAGRQVTSVQVLERIAVGLKIPLHRFGLSSVPPPPRARPQVLSTSQLRKLIDGKPAESAAAPQVRDWTGLEIRRLREALRMSVREFAYHLGVSDRMVSKWEAGREKIRPRPINQAALDMCLKRASPDVHERFVSLPGKVGDNIEPMKGSRWVIHVIANTDNLEAAQLIAERLVTQEPMPEVSARDTTVSPVGTASYFFSVFCNQPTPRSRCDMRRGHSDDCRDPIADEPDHLALQPSEGNFA